MTGAVQYYNILEGEIIQYYIVYFVTFYIFRRRTQTPQPCQNKNQIITRMNTIIPRRNNGATL